MEIRLYDPRREPRDWIDLMRPSQCAVLLKDRTSSIALAQDGQPYGKASDVGCIVFDRLETAQRFCQAKVQALPHVRCEIYDAEGMVHPPLAEIVHPDYQSDEESSSTSSRRRRVAAGGLLVATPLLFWIGARWSDDLTPILAANCIIVALRFLHWDFGLKHSEQERRKRLEAHHKLEQSNT